MSKSRKEQFEGQLRDLQKDISTLSQKLSVPTVTSSHSFTGRSNEGNLRHLQINSLLQHFNLCI